MNSANSHETISYLEKLNSKKHDCVIKVRVSRLWNVFDIDNQIDLLSTEIVLIDEKVFFSFKNILSDFIPLIF